MHRRTMPRNITAHIATAFSLGLAILAPLSLSACGNAEDERLANAGTTGAEQGYELYSGAGTLGEKALRAVVAPMFEDPLMAETRALVILHNGKLVAERYAPGYGPDTRLISWSMAKSVTATLLGMMVSDGRLSLDEPAPVSAWHNPGDQRAKITLRHLLQMSSGLDHTEGLGPGAEIAIYEADTPRMLFLDGREDVARYATSRPMEAGVGEKFEYSSATSNILVDIMTRSLTESEDPVERRDAMLEYARGRLFDPLGMDSMAPEFDRHGTMLGGSMIHATARDWAKFGEFLRNDGAVRSAKLLPTSWVRFMRKPSPNDASYGGHIWINRKRPEGRDQVLFPGRAPDDVFAALGHLGQFVVVSPQHHLVVVRLGKTANAEMGPVNDQLARIINAFPKGK